MMFRDSPLFGQFASDNPIVIAPFWTGVMTAVKVTGYYLALVIWPAELSCDYSYNAVTLFGWTLTAGQDPHAWAALAVVLGLLAAVGRRLAARSRRLVLSSALRRRRFCRRPTCCFPSAPSWPSG